MTTFIRISLKKKKSIKKTTYQNSGNFDKPFFHNVSLLNSANDAGQISKTTQLVLMSQLPS